MNHLVVLHHYWMDHCSVYLCHNWQKEWTTIKCDLMDIIYFIVNSHKSISFGQSIQSNKKYVFLQSILSAILISFLCWFCASGQILFIEVFLIIWCVDWTVLRDGALFLPDMILFVYSCKYLQLLERLRNPTKAQETRRELSLALFAVFIQLLFLTFVIPTPW